MQNPNVSGGAADVLKRLAQTRKALVDELWDAAQRVTGPEAWDQLRELARLRADILGIDFAIEHAPQA